MLRRKRWHEVALWSRSAHARVRDALGPRRTTGRAASDGSQLLRLRRRAVLASSRSTCSSVTDLRRRRATRFAAVRRAAPHAGGSGRHARSRLAPWPSTANLRARPARASIPDEQRVNDGESVLDQHAADLSYHPPHRPDVVVFPESAAEVAAVLAYADERRRPGRALRRRHEPRRPRDPAARRDQPRPHAHERDRRAAPRGSHRDGRSPA